jgi:dipeptidyl aminopeptidase/acylaminoacyl peptidase
MTDERIDALIRRLDVPSDPDPSFVRTTYATMRPRARAARVSDASRIGRLRRDLRLVLSGAAWPVMPRRAGTAGFVALLILAAMAAIAIVGALNQVQPIQNGPLVVSIEGELRVIDPLGGPVRTIAWGGNDARGVSRSPDGRLVAFWTIGDGRSHLHVMGLDGRDRRELASDLQLGWTDAIDVWSSDSHFLATEVTLDGKPARIIVADVATGSASVVTPPEVFAHNPLWSPDGRWIAFTEESNGTRSLAVIRTDGSDKRTISGDVFGVAGPDTWSPDGAWIYFGSDSDGGVYRANVAGGFSQLLIGNGLELEVAHAPASSPDGTLIVFIVPRSDGLGYDLYIANSDGSGAHRLLERATHDGWSADGHFVLVEWTPATQPGGLAVIAPDGSEFQVVLPFDAVCQHGPRCTDGVGWGQPRP